MAAGNKTYRGLAVPLNGESEIKQVTAATDILTITGASGQSGKFLVLRNSSESEIFSISSAGALAVTSANLTIAGTQRGLVFSGVPTTKATTGYTKGQLFIMWHGSIPRIAICTSTAGDILKYRAVKSKTLGRLT